MTMALGKQTGSLMNHAMSSAAPIKPQIGMGVTVLGWTDRYAGTIIEIIRNGFVVQQDKAIRTDSNGMSESQSYRYEPNPDGRIRSFRQVMRGKAKGAWRESSGSGSTGVLIGHRRAYHDYSF